MFRLFYSVKHVQYVNMNGCYDYNCNWLQHICIIENIKNLGHDIYFFQPKVGNGANEVLNRFGSIL